MIGGMALFMYFFVIRPQRKEEKRKKEMLSSLKKGDRIVTTSGILGTVASVKDETVF
ncbi:MAG: preprotein translocase subunit YajC, partial [Leptospiraceae bacterium]|nr:preprotein translocase subunit YajC [Leptospiraceae bacterium]